MVLTDIDGTVLWQTNTTSTNVATAELLNTGNLVSKNPSGEILWQSFDFPTNTLLPSQILTKNTRLTSVMTTGSYASGYFNLYFGSDNLLRMISDNSDTSTSYWPNPDLDIYQNHRTNYNSSRIATLNGFGRFRSSDQWRFNTTDRRYGILRRLTMDCDGNLRVYSLNNSTGLWDITWQAISQPCLVKGVCGRNALCVYTPKPKCTCPPEFVVNDPNDWNAGCKATFNQTLLRSLEVKFMEIPHTDYYGFDLNTTNTVTWEACRDMCVADFRCQAFSYRLMGTGYCYIKSALLNGFTSPDFPGNIYLKLPNTLQDLEARYPRLFHDTSPSCLSGEEEEIVMGSPSMYDFNHRRVKWVYFYSFAGALGTIELFFIALCWWFLLRKNGVSGSVEAGSNMLSGQFRRYDYSELKKATGNFEEELGRGGSGTVYKGVLSDERVVAVKRLRGDFYQAGDEYFAEISTLGKINHMNLVRMWGFCSGKRHRILVYEFLDNLSLDRHIFG